jgi:hypothetical protein
MYKYFKRREKQQKISLAQNISPILSRLHKYVKKVVTKLIPSKNYCTCLGLGGWQHFDQNCTFSLLKYLQAEPTHMSCRQFLHVVLFYDAVDEKDHHEMSLS